MEELKNKIKDNTNIDNEFIDTFYNYIDVNDFCINLSICYIWLGFSRAEHLKRLLIKPKLGFKINEDYIINKMGVGMSSRKETILIKPETFKMLAMCAQTDKGYLTRKYYIQMEQEYRKLCNNVIKEPLRFPINEYYLNIELDLSQYKDKYVVYLLHIEDNFYKYGWSSNFLRRYLDHKSRKGWFNYIKIFDCKTIENAKAVESRFKKYLNTNNLSTTYIDKNKDNNTEVFRTNKDLSEYINLIDKYVEEEIKKNALNYNINYYDKEKELRELEITRIKELQNLNKINENTDNTLNNKINLLENKINEILKIISKNEIIKEENEIINEENEIINEENEIINEENEIINGENEIINEEINEVENIRKCSKCKKNKELTEEFFRLKTNGIYTSYCIECLERDKIRCAKKREERNKYNKEYQEKIKENIKKSEIPLHKCGNCSQVLEVNDTNFEKKEDGSFKKVCIPCTEKSDANREEINRKHRENAKKTGSDKKYYEKHREKKLKHKKEKYLKEIDNFREKNKTYYDNNREDIIEHKKIKIEEKKFILENPTLFESDSEEEVSDIDELDN
jgi:predicted GIY-YIG superfamily endonuclease